MLSLHPHNDRGCAVAAAELGVLPAPIASKAVCSAMVSAPATSRRHVGDEPVQPGHRSELDITDIGTLRHCRILQPPTGARASSLRRRLGVHNVSGSHQAAIKKGLHNALRRVETAGRERDYRSGACRTCPSILRVGRSYEAVIG